MYTVRIEDLGEGVFDALITKGGATIKTFSAKTRQTALGMAKGWLWDNDITKSDVIILHSPVSPHRLMELAGLKS